MKSVKEIECMSFYEFKKEMSQENYDTLIEIDKDVFLVYEQYQQSASLCGEESNLEVNEYIEWVIEQESYKGMI